MRNKKIAAVCMAALLLGTLTGCQLALADKGTEATEDRLVGVFVTTEYLDLFDMEGYLNDNIGRFQDGEIMIDGNGGKYQGRLYAELKKKTIAVEETGETFDTEEYTFESVAGFSFFTALVPATKERTSYYTTMSDDGISDSKTGIVSKDEGNALDLEGTIYVSPSGEQNAYYINPVYQDAEGRVYATSGSGFFTGEGQAEGQIYSQTLSATTTLTENGKTVKNSASVKITLNVMNPPKKIVLLQMDRNSSVVSRAEYAPGTLPKEISPEPGVEYIVIETHKTGSDGNDTVARTLYGKDAQTLYTFYCREDGVCVKQWTQVNWS